MAMLDGDTATRAARNASIVVPAPAARPPVPALHERSGQFEIRLASGEDDLRRTQRLRYKVFFEEGGAIAATAAARLRLDLCSYDSICDHLVVIDHGSGAETGEEQQDGEGRIVGTYRLLRRDIADRHGGFYSQAEFDLRPMLDAHPDLRVLELGRSCVHVKYRSKRVVEMLWRGLYLYASMHSVEALIGCASLPGTNLDALRLPLSFLLRHVQAHEEWQVSPLPHCAAAFEPLPAEAIDARRALASLPPLIKAYLRTGARFGRRAVLDRQFGTTDVFAVMPMGDIEERYLAHYGQPSCVSGTPVA